MGFMRFDTLRGLHEFHRKLASYGVWFSPELRLTTEGLYVCGYDRDRLEEIEREKEMESERVWLVEDLFI